MKVVSAVSGKEVDVFRVHVEVSQPSSFHDVYFFVWGACSLGYSRVQDELLLLTKNMYKALQYAAELKVALKAEADNESEE